MADSLILNFFQRLFYDFNRNDMRSARHGCDVMMFGCVFNIVLLRTDSTDMNCLPKDLRSVNDTFTVILGTIVLNREFLPPRTALHRSPSFYCMILFSSTRIIPKT